MARLHTQTFARPKTTQSVSVGATSAATSNAIASGITIVRLLLTGATANAFVTQGATPTATTSHMPLINNEPEFITVHPGEKIAVIGTDGTLYVTEMTQ